MAINPIKPATSIQIEWREIPDSECKLFVAVLTGGELNVFIVSISPALTAREAPTMIKNSR